MHHSGLALGLGLFVVCFGQAVAVGAPKIFVAEPVVDLGTVKEGAVARHTFVVENRGDEPLEIKSIKASCSCTVPGGLRGEQRIVSPGESVEIPVEFRSKGKSGRIPSRVTIKSNDPKEPTIDLRLRVFVDTLCTIKPTALYFSRARRGEVAPRHVDIMPGKKNATLELVELKSELPGLEVITEENKVPNQNKVGVRVKVKVGQDVPFGRVSSVLNGRVRVGTEEKAIRIRINGQVVGDVTVLPPFIARTSPLKRDARVGEIIIRANKDAEVVVKAAIARSKQIVTEVVEQETNKDYRVKLNLAKDVPGGPLATTVDVFTNSKDLPITSVPVFVNVEELVQITPMWVYLNANGEPGGRRLVTLSSLTRSPLTIEKVECEDPDIVTRITLDPAEKHVVRLEVSLKPDAEPGDHHTLLNIKTNIPGADRLQIPVRAVAEVKKASAR